MECKDARRKWIKSARSEINQLQSRTLRLRGARRSLGEVTELLDEALDDPDALTFLVSTALEKLKAIDPAGELRGQSKHHLSKAIRYLTQAALWQPPLKPAPQLPAIQPEPSPAELADRRKTRWFTLVGSVLGSLAMTVAAWIGSFVRGATRADPGSVDRPSREIRPASDTDNRELEKATLRPSRLAN